MFDLSDPKMFWLNVTNIVLGIVTLVCCVVVGYGLVKEVLVRIRKPRTTPFTSDDHAFLVPDLGVTMADGGERVAKASTVIRELEQTNVSRPHQEHNSKKK